MTPLIERYRSAAGSRRWLWALACFAGAYLPLTIVQVQVWNESGPPLKFYLPLALCIGVGVFAVALVVVTSKMRPEAPAPLGQRRSLWLVSTKYAALPVFVFLGYLVVFYPAMMNVDSYEQWGQIIGYHFDAFFPLANTIVYWLPTLVWRSPASSMLLQLVCLALSFGYAMAIIEREGAPPWVPWALTLFFAFHPVNGYFSVSFLKDTLFSAAILWLTVVVFLVVRTSGAALGNRSTLVHLTLALAFVALLRPNGPAPALATAALLLVFYRNKWRPLLASLAACLAIYWGTNIGLARVTHLSFVHSGFYAASPFIYDIGAVLHSDLVNDPENARKGVVAEDGKTTKEERAVLQQFDDVDEWGRIYKNYMIPYWHAKHDNWDLLDQPDKKAELVRTWFSIARRNPGVILEHKVASSRIGWRINSGVIMETYAPTAKRLNMDVPHFAPRVTRAMSKFLNWMQARERRWLFCHPGIWTYGGFLMIASLAIRRRSALTLLIATPMAFNWLSMLAFCMAQNTRYFYSSLVVLPFVVALPWTVAGNTPMGSPEHSGRRVATSGV